MKLILLIPVLLLFAFWSCQQETVKAPAFTKAQLDKLTYIAENVENTKLSREEQTKVWAQFDKLSYPEMEEVIDLRYAHNVRTKAVDAQRAKYLLDLRHSVNRQAFKLKKTSFYRLSFADSEEVLVSLGMRTGAAAPDQQNPGPQAGVPAAPGGRTSVEGGSCPSGCTAWVPSPYSVSFSSNYASAAKWYPAQYKGLRTIEKNGTCQPDCDYLFWFTFPKVYFTKYILRRGIPTNTIGLEGSSWPARVTDNNPPYNSDCGTWTQEVILGATRINIWYLSPEIAAGQIELAVVNAVENAYCNVGLNLFLYGNFYKTISAAEASFYPDCTCVSENKNVR